MQQELKTRGIKSHVFIGSQSYFHVIFPFGNVHKFHEFSEFVVQTYLYELLYISKFKELQGRKEVS